jgi:phosphate transport system permease protein
MSVRTRVRTLDRVTVQAAGVLGSLATVTVFSFIAGVGNPAYPALLFAAASVVGLVTHQGETVKVLLFLAALSTVLVLGLIMIYLVYKALPVFAEMGIGLLVRTEYPLWSTAEGVYSLAPMMWGTIVTTTLAMLIAGPLGLAGAVFISEIAPDWARDVIKPGVEILAGIPSIVYGFIGFMIINDFMMAELQLPDYGSLFAAGLVIGVMALPTVVSVAEDALASVPESMKSGSRALGSTDWQTVTSVTIPAALSGISAAVLLGVGRAVGETMAAVVILGNIPEFPDPLIDVFGNSISLTSLIASQYGPASGGGGLHLSALFAAGVVLFVTVMVLSVGSQLIERRMEQKLGGDQ